MKAALTFAGIALALASARPARADDADQVRGYLLSRFQLFPTNTHALLYPLLDVQKYQGFLEGNLDLTLHADRFTIRSDTSALYRVSPAGCRANATLDGCIIINELYVNYELVKDRVNVLVGRHRASWGSAMSYHPVEPMNPQPDPTDPTFQRLGAWTALAELSGDKFVATAAWFPDVTHSELGTPSNVAAGLVGGRFAYRPESFDVSVMAFDDLETGNPSAGAAGSTTIGESSFEVHGEALVHERREIKTGTLEKGTCPIQSLGIPLRQQWDFTSIVGSRWDAGGGALVNLEYLHNGDGMVTGDFNSVLATADLLNMMCPNGRLEPPDATKDGRPQQLSSTFLRRNYGILSGVKPSFGDSGKLANLGATATVFVGLDDLSGVVTGRLVYTVADSTILRLGGLGVFGGARTQYGILPFHMMMLFDVQTLF